MYILCFHILFSQTTTRKTQIYVAVMYLGLLGLHFRRPLVHLIGGIGDDMGSSGHC